MAWSWELCLVTAVLLAQSKQICLIEYKHNMHTRRQNKLHICIKTDMQSAIVINQGKLGLFHTT